MFLAEFLSFCHFYTPLDCKCITAGFTVRHLCKMHWAPVHCATSPLFVIIGHTGVQITSSVDPLLTAFLAHSRPHSAFSLHKSPLTNAAPTGPENETVVGVTQPSVTLQLCVCVGVIWQVSNLSWTHTDWALSLSPPTHTHTQTQVKQVGAVAASQTPSEPNRDLVSWAVQELGHPLFPPIPCNWIGMSQK